MKYMGSKAKITKYIVPIIQQKIDESMKAKEHFRATEKLFMWGGGNGK